MNKTIKNLPVPLEIKGNRLGTMEYCWVCIQKVQQGSTFEDHHIIPRHLGGENGPLVFLHADCHTHVHRMANALIKSKTIEEIYTNGNIQKRAESLAHVIFRAHIALKNTGKLEELKKTKYSTEFDPRINKKLKELSRHLGMSQDKTIQYAIELAYSLRIGNGDK